MLQWKMVHPQATYDMLGYVPQFLSENDPRSAKDQIANKYISGWHAFRGHTMRPGSLVYPGDPPARLIAETHLRDETIRFYEGAWMAIIQPDGSYEVSRVD